MQPNIRIHANGTRVSDSNPLPVKVLSGGGGGGGGDTTAIEAKLDEVIALLTEILNKPAVIADAPNAATAQMMSAANPGTLYTAPE